MALGMELGAAAWGTMLFAYFVLLRLPVGILRLLAVLPWLVLLYSFPSRVPTVHMRALVSFFFLWLIPFKLLLLCWNRGPAGDPSVRNSFPRFFATMALSVNVPRCGTFLESGGGSGRTTRTRSPLGWIVDSQAWQAVLLRAIFKFCLVVLLFSVYSVREGLPDVLLYLVYSWHVYLACSLIFEAIAAAAAASVGLELEPQFDMPFLASSISDFWGRRWNRLVSSILRASVYEPVIALCATSSKAAGESSVDLAAAAAEEKRAPSIWVRGLATLLVFLVSGLMHELIFFHMNKSEPTWEATAFFVLNGFATVAEVVLRRACKGRLKVPRALSVALTLNFIFWTAAWLFFPAIQRTGTCFEALREFEAILSWMHSLTMFKSSTQAVKGH